MIEVARELLWLKFKTLGKQATARPREGINSFKAASFFIAA